MAVKENLALVRERMQAAAHRAGRNPDEVALMAVSKTVAPERIREAFAAGLHLFGENRVQEFATKRDALLDLAAEWRLIGHLQSNKAAHAAELFAAVDSLDTLRLARKLDRAAQSLGRTLPVLIEVNIAGEAAKSGLAPDSRELEELLSSAPEFHNIEIRGLMCVPPLAADPEAARPYFRKLRELRERLAARKLPQVGLETLSMGMSHDFEIAIEEGSTCVRVGTALFGERKQP